MHYWSPANTRHFTPSFKIRGYNVTHFEKYSLSLFLPRILVKKLKTTELTYDEVHNTRFATQIRFIIPDSWEELQSAESPRGIFAKELHCKDTYSSMSNRRGMLADSHYALTDSQALMYACIWSYRRLLLAVRSVFSSEKQEADFAKREKERERKDKRSASARFRIRMVIDGIGYYKLRRKSYLSAVKGQVK